MSWFSLFTQTFDWLPDGMDPLADGEYDAIVLGTGLKECVISGLLSVKGKKVLQVDRNGYYGGDGASLNLTTLFEKFQAGEAPSNLGANRDYNVDLIPKVSLWEGVVRMSLRTEVILFAQFTFFSFIFSSSWPLVT